MTNHHQVWIYPISVPYRLLYFSTVTPSCVLCLLRLCLFSFHIALKLCPFVPLSFQECPSGVVNEDTFKQIYSQFFPHGGEVCVCVCCDVCIYVRLCLCTFSCQCISNFFLLLLQMPAPTRTTCSMHLTQDTQDP